MSKNIQLSLFGDSDIEVNNKCQKIGPSKLDGLQASSSRHPNVQCIYRTNDGCGYNSCENDGFFRLNPDHARCGVNCVCYAVKK